MNITGAPKSPEKESASTDDREEGGPVPHTLEG